MIRRILYKAFSSIGSAEVRRFEQASQNCALAQKAKLFEIIGPNINTEYGRQHQFRLIKTVADFQKAVPINNYDNLSASIERMASGESNILTAEDPFMFATTSGTTGARKLIPVNKSYLKEFRRASVISGHNLLSCYPDIAGGVALSIFSPAEEGRTEGNLPY